jgi:hypothetical protein
MCRDTTPHSQSLGWSASVEETYVSQVRRIVDAKFGVGRKLPFALQALRYKGGCRKSPHFDPAGYTVIAGLNVCGNVDITLTKVRPGLLMQHSKGRRTGNLMLSTDNTKKRQ